MKTKIHRLHTANKKGYPFSEIALWKNAILAVENLINEWLYYFYFSIKFI